MFTQLKRIWRNIKETKFERLTRRCEWLRTQITGAPPEVIPVTARWRPKSLPPKPGSFIVIIDTDSPTGSPMTIQWKSCISSAFKFTHWSPIPPWDHLPKPNQEGKK